MKVRYGMGYIQELRKQVGTAPLIMVGACVLIFLEAVQWILIDMAQRELEK